MLTLSPGGSRALPNWHFITVSGNELEQSECTGLEGFPFDQLSVPLEAPLHK